MWKCSECGREFKNPGQRHFCGKIESVDDYISDQPEEIQTVLNEVRTLLQKILPEATEKISWGMPTYWKGRNIIHFAAQSKHMGLYPGAEAVAYFADRLKGYKFSKGSIQFPYANQIPYDLIAEIAQWCKKEAEK